MGTLKTNNMSKLLSYIFYAILNLISVGILTLGFMGDSEYFSIGITLTDRELLIAIFFYLASNQELIRISLDEKIS